MSEYTLVDCVTGLIYGPYETFATARAHADAKAIATWEIITDDDKLVDWSRPDPIARSDAPLKDAVTRERVYGQQEYPKRVARRKRSAA